jgi:hypothetical protein
MEFPVFGRPAAAALALGMLGLGAAAQASPLTVVNVSAPAINCVFNATCHVTVTDSRAFFPPATGYSGRPKLITRTIEGAPGSPAEGLNGYLYRVDFTRAHAETDINCVVWLKLRFGEVSRLPYGEKGEADIFVITAGGAGTVGVSSAEKVGRTVTITFTEPVCPINGATPGQSSFWVGLASPGGPVGSHAKAQLTFGGGVVSVRARTPALPQG